MQLEFGLEKAWNDWWWAIDNVLISVPTDPAKLFINTANGQAFFGGDDVIPSEVTGINITSKTSLLQVINNGGLSHSIDETADGPDPDSTPGDSPGEQWESLTSTNKQFAEAFLFGSSSFDDARRELLGVLIDANTFDQQAAEATDNIQMTYSLASGELVKGIVEYFYDPTPILPGDYNNNGVVDAADYVVWRRNEGTSNPLPNDPDGGMIGSAQYNTWRSNFGNTLSGAGQGSGGLSSSTTVPEPTSLLLVVLGFAGTCLWRRRSGTASLCTLFLTMVTLNGVASAAVPPSPFLDRSYLFGEDDAGGTIGQPVSQMDSFGHLVTYDSAGETGKNQLIDLIAESPTSRKATYVSTTDRPDGNGDIGLQLNPLSFDRQYLRTGFGEALNFPEQSPSSSASLINPGGTINYYRINDRGFELWAKPTSIAGTQDIVMDSQQHGVLIDQNGKFAMRYGSRFQVDTEQLPGPDGMLGTEDDILNVSDPVITPADYETNVVEQTSQWYHLSVVRPFGPNQGSIFYINGVAEAIAFGEYAVETIVNVGEGEVFTNIDSLDISPLTVGRATTTDAGFNVPLGQENFFHGIVDDLRMFVMGLNDNDNLPGGGTNVLNDYGEYIFQRDNGYAQAFAPSQDGDLSGDNVVTLTDANLFAANWLYEKRMTAVNPITGVEGSRLVGDLSTRALGDFNYDGIVDLRDWAILNNENPSAGVAAMALINGAYSVPEPSCIGLASLALVALSLAVHRRGKQASP